jgi:hypothetical protein
MNTQMVLAMLTALESIDAVLNPGTMIADSDALDQIHEIMNSASTLHAMVWAHEKFEGQRT